MTVSGSLPEVGELSSTADPKVRTLLNELKTATTELETVQHAVKWYEPKIIATEQSTTSTSFTTLSTADEITGVVVPTNGIIRVGYVAAWLSSVSGAGRAALTVDGVSVVTLNPVAGSAETQSVGVTYHALSTASIDPRGVGGGNALVPGAVELQATIPANLAISFVEITNISAGTHAVAVKYRATSGSVTARERKLWVEVHGT